MSDPTYALSILPPPLMGPQPLAPPGGRPPDPIYPSVELPPPTIVPAQTGWTPAPSNLAPRQGAEVAPAPGMSPWVKGLLAAAVVAGGGWLVWKFKFAEEYAANDDDDGDEHYERNASVDFLTSDDDDSDDGDDGDDGDDEDDESDSRETRRASTHRMVANSSPMVQKALEYASFCEAMKNKST